MLEVASILVLDQKLVQFKIHTFKSNYCDNIFIINFIINNNHNNNFTKPRQNREDVDKALDSAEDKTLRARMIKEEGAGMSVPMGLTGNTIFIKNLNFNENVAI